MPEYHGIPLGYVSDLDPSGRSPRFYFMRGVQDGDEWRCATLDDFEPGGLLHEQEHPRLPRRGGGFGVLA